MVPFYSFMNVIGARYEWKSFRSVEALLLAGRASCNLKDYKSATGYFQSAKCYDYKRSDVTERLNTLKTLRGGADGL